MCLVIFAHNAAADYPLLVAANRDEFHARATAPSTFWSDHPGILAGRDLEQGGTWMGLTRCGRFAAITNFRDPNRTRPAPRSRGELPLAFLQGQQSVTGFMDSIGNSMEEYAGFNLVVGDGAELGYASNANDEPPRLLPAGIYGLSNAALDTPWPKVVKGKEALGRLLTQSAISHEALLEVVADRSLAEKDVAGAKTPQSEMEYLLSAQFIITPGYGTRSSTTAWLTRDGTAEWRELSFNADGETISERHEAFTLGNTTD